ncbi:MAG: AAA family ATPase, partial [Donghicola eburneus]
IALNGSRTPTPMSDEALLELISDLDAEHYTSEMFYHDRYPRVHFAQSALRCAKTFGSEQGLETALLSKGRVMVVEVDPALHECTIKLLSILVKSMTSLKRAYVKDISWAAENTYKANITAQTPLGEEALDALEKGIPLILVKQTQDGVPAQLARMAGTTIPLAALDQDILTTHFAWRYPKCAIAQNLPTTVELTDAELAAVTPDLLLCAFRAHSWADAIQILKTDAHSNPTAPSKTFADFPLTEAQRAPLDQLVTDLKEWRAGTLAWEDVSRGVLLYGPPGTGKTEIARLLAKDANVTLLAGSVGAWLSNGGRSGDVIKAMRKFFRDGIEQAPCLLFLDEVDATGNRLRPHDQNSAWTDLVVGSLLEELDGFAQREGIAVIAATNHLKNIDPALRRPGRFDRLVQLDHPGLELLPDVLRWHLRSDLLGEDVAKLTPLLLGMSGADIAQLVRQARGEARKERRALQLADLDRTLQEKQGVMSDEARRRIAVHEAGHAIVLRATSGRVPQLLAVLSNGGMMQSTSISAPMTADVANHEMATLLAGRAAETLIFGQASIGAGGDPASDLAQATRLAAGLEMSWGLGATGACWLGTPDEVLARLYLDTTLQREVNRHLETAETRATAILQKYQVVLAQLSSQLYEAGVLHEDMLTECLSDVGLEGAPSDSLRDARGDCQEAPSLSEDLPLQPDGTVT